MAESRPLAGDCGRRGAVTKGRRKLGGVAACVRYFDCGDSWLYAYDKTYQIVCFKYLLILVCLLCLSNAVFLKKHLHLLILRAGPKQGPDRCTRASFMHSEDFIYFKRVLAGTGSPLPLP